MSSTPLSPPQAPVLITPAELNSYGGVYCPNPKGHMNVRDNHPRIYLALAPTGHATCPYCSTTYELVGGAPAGGGH